MELITPTEFRFVHYLIYLVLQLSFVIRVLVLPYRQPASRVAWIAVIMTLPVFGMILYALFGEAKLGEDTLEKRKKVHKKLAQSAKFFPSEKSLIESIPEIYQSIFLSVQSINGLPPHSGNGGTLFSDSNKTINSIVSDIDHATKHAHLLFYIWLPDNNGTKIVESLKRAAKRGVKCRIMVDGLGSRSFIKSKLWNELKASGVDVATALPIDSFLLKPFKNRLDIRNHRKIVVVDNQIGYCGSQNCADPEFLVKAKYAPWVDAVIRLQGPVVHQLQLLFLNDWMIATEEDASSVLSEFPARQDSGFIAQAFGTGPTGRHTAMPDVFETMFFAAFKKLTITTPYYVPDESLQNALCSAALRGVDVTIIFPERNDSFIVSATSRSYYWHLLKSGVKIFEFKPGLLHTKSITMDGCVSLVGSANMDRRSFELNFENNVLYYSKELTQNIEDLQKKYMDQSTLVSLESVEKWTRRRVLWNNTMATLSPLF